MDDTDILLRRPAEGVLTLRLNRPEKRNAISTPLLKTIAQSLRDASADDTVRCVVITGTDRIFAAGADIGEMTTRTGRDTLRDIRPSLWQEVRAFRKPLLGAVEGWCLGAGNELLMCCDIAVAGTSAVFGQPETNLGIIPGAGGTATLPRLVGKSVAMRMVLLGDVISASDALGFGLISEVVDDGLALSTAEALSARIAARAPMAMEQGKAMINSTFDVPHTAHLALERQAFANLHATSDKNEGIEAFLEKRSPTWVGA